MAGRHASPDRTGPATPGDGAEPRRATPAGGRRATRRQHPLVRRVLWTALALAILTAGAVPAVQRAVENRRAAADVEAAESAVQAVADEQERREAHERQVAMTSRSWSMSGRAVAEREVVLTTCDSTGPQPSGPNGRLPESALCIVPGADVALRADAAEAWAMLQESFKEDFGRYPCVNNGYRSYAQQAKMHAANPGMVAAPGTSNHGLGLALDLCTGTDGKAGTSAWAWMSSHAAEFGWNLPSWARPGGSRPEPWHWEYVASGDRVS